MKKIRKIFRAIWLERAELLEALSYIITFGWVTYVGRVVHRSDTSIAGKIFFTVWLIVLVFWFVINKYCKDEE